MIDWTIVRSGDGDIDLASITTAFVACFGMCTEAAVDMAEALLRHMPVVVIYGGVESDARRFAFDRAPDLGLVAEIVSPIAPLPDHHAWVYVRGEAAPDDGAIRLLRAKLAES